MNKERTGKLIAEARKEKRMTQQELADRLHITGKAVSKWETGVSVPDISLLVPLSETLGLSVTELLEGQRAVIPGDRTPEQVEDIVKTAIAFSEDAPEKKTADKRKRVWIFAACVVLAALEFGLLWLVGAPETMSESISEAYARGAFTRNGGSHYLVMVLISVAIGAYAMFGIRERLPSYYDDNEVHFFSDGFLRISMMGIAFNNRNWPHIVHALRIWSVLAMVLTIPIYAAVAVLFPAFYARTGQYALLLFLGGLFVPIYVAGRKYK